jgi:hypothetical protein
VTTDAQVRELLTQVSAGTVEYRNGMFFIAGVGFDPSERSGRILRELVLSGWAEKVGSLVKLTADGERELGAS